MFVYRVQPFSTHRVVFLNQNKHFTAITSYTKFFNTFFLFFFDTHIYHETIKRRSSKGQKERKCNENEENGV